MTAAVLRGLLLLLLCTWPSYASRLKLNQLDHQGWTLRDGAPSGINHFAEAPDGTLWLACDSGLFRFDGVHFTLFQPTAGDPALPGTAFSDVFVARDGTVWASFFTSRDLLAIRDGHVHLYGEQSGLPNGSKHGLQESPDGTLWVKASGGPLHLSHERWISQANEHVFSAAMGRSSTLFFDSQGTEWISDQQAVWFLRHGAKQFARWSENIPHVVGFLQAPDGSLWLGQQGTLPGQGSVRRFVDPGGNATAGPRLPLEVARDGLFTRDGALWIANGTHGLLQASLVPSQNAADASPRFLLQTFQRLDGLTSDAVSILFQDRAGNMWAGTDKGLDRFSSPLFIRYTDRMLRDNTVITSCPDGNTYFGDDDSPLLSVHGETSSTYGISRDFHTMYCDRKNVVWEADDSGLWRFRAGAFQSVPLPPELHKPEVWQITGEDEHRLFFDLGSDGTWLLADGAWSKILPFVDGFLEDSQGNLWHSGAEGSINIWNGSADRQVGFAHAEGLGNAWVFCESRRGMLVGGLKGIAVLRSGQFHHISAADPTALAAVSGLLEAPNGDLWLNAARGVVHVAAAEVDRALISPEYRVNTETFGGDRGIDGPATQVYGRPSAVADASGRFWFSNEGTVTYLDPVHALSPPAPPAVTINGATLNGIPQTATRLTFRSGAGTLRIAYFGVDMARPQDVVYRYRLDGIDKDWQAAGASTEAVYTSLRPGTYTFHVSASNKRDLWSDAAPYRFTVLPAFYQTRWFFVLCLCTAGLLVWCAYILRVRFLAARIRDRAEERMNERLRVARDLHDTLLQSVQGLLLRVEYVSATVANDGTSREALQGALCSAERVLNEGRDRVKHLREEQVVDLATALTNAGEDLNWGRDIAFKVSVQGTSRPLRPEVREECYWIAREAIVNAFRHARPSHIEILVSYGNQAFQLMCRDDGQGMDTLLVRSTSAPGHFGMHGMRERAQRIQAELHQTSRLGEGTTIELKLGARKAYLPAHTSMWQKLSAPFGRWIRHGKSPRAAGMSRS